MTQLPFWTRGRLGELLACLATPLPKEAKKGGEAALLAVVTLDWLLESMGASAGGSWCKIALVCAEKQDALRGAKPGALWLLAGAQFRPALPSALDLGHRGRITWAL